MTGSVVSSACVALLVAALSMPAFAETPEPAASADPGPLRMHDGRISFTATALRDGSVLVVGGNNVWYTLGSAEVYEPATQRFRVVGSLGTPRYGHRATALPDGRVLITGGSFGGNPRGITSVEAYDPATETFSPVGRLKEPRFAHAASLLDDGQVLITGGYGKNPPNPKSSAEVFDPRTGTSTSIGKMRRARAGHVATRLEDGRIAIIGGVRGGGPGERTLEVYDPLRQRFSRPLELPAPPNVREAPGLHDGRIFVAANRGAILVAPDARSSEQIEGPPYRAGQVTATLLDDGRVLVTGGSSAYDPARVIVFDPATGTFQPADPMRNRALPAVVRLDEGTVLIVGGINSVPGCMQALPTAGIWDPAEMAVVAGDAEVPCVDEILRPPLRPLGAETSGGRIEMPGSAFAITVPDDWTVELADPDTDVFSAEPGSAWEALRVTDPAGTRACSVAIGVAEVSLRKRSGIAPDAVIRPVWLPAERGTLVVPWPVEAIFVEDSIKASTTRLHQGDEGLEHDAIYSVLCVDESERGLEAIADSLEAIADSLELLPSRE